MFYIDLLSNDTFLPKLPPRPFNFSSSEVIEKNDPPKKSVRAPLEFGSLLRLPRPKNSDVQFSHEPEVMPGVFFEI